MLEFVSQLPDKIPFGLEKSVAGSLVLTGVIIPLCVLICVLLFAVVLSLAEGEGIEACFYFVVSAVCGIANPLTLWQPESHFGCALVMVVGVASQGVVGIIIGIAAALQPLVRVMAVYDEYFSGSSGTSEE